MCELNVLNRGSLSTPFLHMSNLVSTHMWGDVVTCPKSVVVSIIYDMVNDLSIACFESEELWIGHN